MLILKQLEKIGNNSQLVNNKGKNEDEDDGYESDDYGEDGIEEDEDENAV